MKLILTACGLALTILTAAGLSSPAEAQLPVASSLDLWLEADAGVTSDATGRTRIRCLATRSRATRSTTVSPISMISLTWPGGGVPGQQVASTSTTFTRRAVMRGD